MFLVIIKVLRQSKSHMPTVKVPAGEVGREVLQINGFLRSLVLSFLQ
jgi:hypothetical protein